MSDIVYNTETGFGSPSLADYEEVYFDRGFGTPVLDDEVILSRDTAFGSPFDGTDFPVGLVGDGEFGDDGGEFIAIFGIWNGLIPTPPRQFVGPFLISVKNRDTLQTTRCKSGLAGFKNITFSDITQRVIKSSIPPLPHGNYDVLINYGFNFSSEIVIEDAITIIRTNRNQSEINIAKSMPNYLATRKDYVGYIPDYLGYRKLGALQAIVGAVGEELCRQISTPYTILTQQLEVDDTEAQVESTLALKDSGFIYIADQLFTYTGKTPTSLTGLAIHQLDRKVHHVRSKVAQDIRNTEEPK